MGGARYESSEIFLMPEAGFPRTPLLGDSVNRGYSPPLYTLPDRDGLSFRENGDRKLIFSKHLSSRLGRPTIGGA